MSVYGSQLRTQVKTSRPRVQQVQGGRSIDSSSAPASASERPRIGESVLQFASELRDEAELLVDGFVFAENNAERIDHFCFSVDRHKGTVGAIAGLWFAKNRLLSKSVTTAAASQKLSSLRSAEILKWGTRKASGK